MKKQYLLYFLLILSVSACVKDPEACFTSSVNEDVATFSNCSLNARSYFWSFGDGGSSLLENPTHTYFSAGTYDVTLIVTDKIGKRSEIKQTVEIPIPDNEIYYGNYYAVETSNNNGTYTYVSLVATVLNTRDQVTFFNLYEGGRNVTANLTNNGLSFSIENQFVSTGFLIRTTSGSASADGRVLNLEFDVIDVTNNAIVDHCVTELIRQ